MTPPAHEPAAGAPRRRPIPAILLVAAAGLAGAAWLALAPVRDAPGGQLRPSRAMAAYRSAFPRFATGDCFLVTQPGPPPTTRLVRVLRRDGGEYLLQRPGAAATWRASEAGIAGDELNNGTRYQPTACPDGQNRN